MMRKFDPTDDTIDHGLTFREWSECGFLIKKGSKSAYRDCLGEPLFLPNQVIFVGIKKK